MDQMRNPETRSRTGLGGWGVSRRGFIGMTAAAAAFGLFGRAVIAQGDAAVSGDPRDIAADAYVFGYPLVLMDITRAANGAGLATNLFLTPPPVDPGAKSVVAPNVDTLYASAWLDLRNEPVIVQAPTASDRYWLLQFMDAWTNTVHNPSSIAPGTAAGQSPHLYAVTGPGWSGTLPEDVTRLPLPTDRGWLIARVENRSAADQAAAEAARKQLVMAPLSAWRLGVRPAPIQVPDAILHAQSTPPPETVARMDGRTFFNHLCNAMAATPPEDAAALARFAGIGIKPGSTDFSLSDADLDAAVQDARQRIADYRNPQAKNENGWSFDVNLGSYGTDYLLRASVAMRALGANLPKDAIYPMLIADAGTLDAPRRYRLRFAPGATPPVDAFWSLTAYTADRYLVSNAAGIYAVGHLVPPVPGHDGSVELAIQAADPGPDVPQGNWLPIPDSGEFGLFLRLYVPKPEAFDGRWQPPALTLVS